MAINGLCACGCQQTTPIATKTDARRGYKKGEPTKFVPGHYARLQTQFKNGVDAPALMQVSAEMTEKDLILLRQCDDDEAARVLDKRAVSIESATRRSFIELGMIAFEMRNRGLWAKLDAGDGVPFHSWEAWVTNRLNVSARSAFAAVSVLDNTRGAVPIEDLQDMSRNNAQQLAKLSSKTQRKMIEAAKTLPEKEFIAEVQKKHPDQHIGKAPALMLAFQDPENRTIFDGAIEVAEFAYDVKGREDALANIIAYFMDGKCEKEGYSRLSNREAFDKAWEAMEV